MRAAGEIVIIDNGLVKEIREEDIELLEPKDDLDAARGVILGVGIGLVFWLGILALILSLL